MNEIILDLGSANSHHNDWGVLATMIDAIIGIDSKKREVIFKHQLWAADNPQGRNERLKWGLFDYAHEYAQKNGYKTTASVFDIASLQFLLDHSVPFMKLANRPDLWWLLGEVPRKVPAYISNYPNDCRWKDAGTIVSLACVSKYPATLGEYELIPNLRGFLGISDHTAGLELWRKYQPPIWEKHYVLQHDETNLDGGAFAITPQELQEVIS
jgi:sialic acid synthase SpsE